MTMGLRAADGTWIQRLGGGDNPLAMMGNVKPMYMNGHENGSLVMKMVHCCILEVSAVAFYQWGALIDLFAFSHKWARASLMTLQGSRITQKHTG